MDTNQGKAGAGMFKNFQSNKYLSGTKDFLSSNSLLAKFAFLLLVIIVFVILLQAGIYFLTWLFSPNQDPVLLKCMLPGKQQKTIYSNPNKGGNGQTIAPILRSKNDRFGVEYTWSTWLNIDPTSFEDSPTQYAKHVFSKTVPYGKSDAPQFANDSGGNITASKTTIKTYPNLPSGILFGNAPGVYLINARAAEFETIDSPSSIVNLLVVTDVLGIDGEPEQIVIEDMPLNKWVNVIIRIKNQRELDVYINGYLRKRAILKNVVAQNQGNVYINFGANSHLTKWDGYISDLRYYNYALGTNAIMAINNAGPNTTSCSGTDSGVPPYLSTRWYFSDTHDMYNP